MAIVARGVTAILQTTLIFLILIYPYRDRLTVRISAVVFKIFIFIVIYQLPYFILFFEPYRMGVLRIVYSCLFILIQSLLISKLLNLSLPFALFSIFAIRNLTDSLTMAAKFMDFVFIPNPANPANSDMLTGTAYLLLLSVFSIYTIRFVGKRIKPYLDYFALKTWRLLWLIPFTYYLFFRVFSDPFYTKAVSAWSPHMMVMPFIWFFGTTLSHYVILKLMSETADTAKLREQLKYFELLADVQRRNYASLQENIAVSKKFRHDIRHYLIALDGYLAVSDVEGGRVYLSDLSSRLSKQELHPYTQNPAINSLLNYYEEKASEAGIEVNLSIRLSDPLSVVEIDFCSILGNLFDNALEACTRHTIENPFISVKIGMVGDSMTIISVRNSYAGQIHLVNGNFISSKRGTEGIGTASVKYMVEHYNGVCNFTYRDNIFEASVLLNPNQGKVL